MVGGGVDEAGLGVGGMQYEQAQREIWPVRVRLGWRGGDGAQICYHKLLILLAYGKSKSHKDMKKIVHNLSHSGIGYKYPHSRGSEISAILK